ncbi:MAG: hypothetical protein SOI56_03045 [Eubacteriales bacterium]
MKIEKGNFGYVKSQRVIRLVRTILLFAGNFALFIIGLVLNDGDRLNIWSVIAVFGMIPAAMSVISLIMIYRVPRMKESDYKAIREHTEGLRILYELYFTSYEKNMFIDATIICGEYVTCYTSTKPSRADLAYMEKHIRKHVLQDGYKVTVKIFDGLDKFLDRADQLAARREDFELERDSNVENTLMAITL